MMSIHTASTPLFRILWTLVLGTSLIVGSGCQPIDKKRERAEVLKDIRDTTVIPDLGSHDTSIQKKSVDRILQSLEKAPEITRNLLVAALDDSMVSARTKRVICTLLADQADLRALAPLIRMLAEGALAEDDLLETALLEFGDRAVPGVATVLAEGGPIARRNAAGILLAISGPRAHDALRSRMLTEKDPEVRFLCVCGLVEDRRSTSLALLGDALDDKDEEVRRAAWGGLSHRARPPGGILFNPAALPEVRVRQAQQVRNWLGGGAVPL
ncbi:MAG: HEAT repeat domain-containing protein [Planctomycetota bacterium]|nr:HEAT repeat domain-containing protein [Planctomycetota bacterium]